MANRDGSLGPAKNYKMADDKFSMIKNCFEHIKRSINGAHGWNRPVEQVDGLTLNFVDANTLRMTHAKYVVSSPRLMDVREKADAQQFLDSIAREIIKLYKKDAGKTLTLKMTNEQQDAQLYSKLSPDLSWAFNNPSYGSYINRYTLTTSRIYKFSAQ